MSTILKALRRLEEDQPERIETAGANSPSDSPAASDAAGSTPLTAASGGLPATDPGAADELRARILAEERASQAAASVGSSQMDEPPSWARLFAPKSTAIGGAVFGILLLGGLAAYWLAPSSSVLGEGLGGVDDTVEGVVASGGVPIEPRLAENRVAMPETARSSPRIAPASRELAARVRDPAIVANATPPARAAAPIVAAMPASTPVTTPSSRPNSRPNSRPMAAAGVSKTSPKPKPSLAKPPEPARAAERAAPEPVRVAVVESRAVANAAAAAKAADRKAREAIPTRPNRSSRAAKPTKHTTPATPTAPSRRVASRAPDKRSEPGATRPWPTERETAPEVVSSAAPTRRPAADAGSSRAAARRPEKSAPAVERLTRPDIPAINIVRTAWHPQADRRSARIRFEGSDETLTFREGDAVGALVIKEITPSSVLFETGGIEIRRRIGSPTSR